MKEINRSDKKRCIVCGERGRSILEHSHIVPRIGDDIVRSPCSLHPTLTKLNVSSGRTCAITASFPFVPSKSNMRLVTASCCVGTTMDDLTVASFIFDGFLMCVQTF
jgi:hypothetical protein